MHTCFLIRNIRRKAGFIRLFFCSQFYGPSRNYLITGRKFEYKVIVHWLKLHMACPENKEKVHWLAPLFHNSYKIICNPFQLDNFMLYNHWIIS